MVVSSVFGHFSYQWGNAFCHWWKVPVFISKCNFVHSFRNISLGWGVGDDGKVPTLELPGRSIKIIYKINRIYFWVEAIFLRLAATSASYLAILSWMLLAPYQLSWTSSRWEILSRTSVLMIVLLWLDKEGSICQYILDLEWADLNLA